MMTIPTQLTPHFTLEELTWCEATQEFAQPTADQLANLMRLAEALEIVRRLCGGRPIRIHSGLRTPAANVAVRGAPHSAHLEGLAADFDVEGMDCDDVRHGLLAHLGMQGWRVEHLDGASWVHLDLREPGFGGRRYFKP